MNDSEIGSGVRRLVVAWLLWHRERVLVIDLDHDEYVRLVLEVDDPDSVANRVNASRADAGK